jgi:hypothetical protein
MKTLYLHGWNSVIGGVKPTHLKCHGHEVIEPALDHEDFKAAPKTAEAAFDEYQPEVMVGSSGRGAVGAAEIHPDLFWRGINERRGGNRRNAAAKSGKTDTGYPMVAIPSPSLDLPSGGGLVSQNARAPLSRER